MKKYFLMIWTQPRIGYPLVPSSSKMRSFPLLSMPEVWELPWLVVDELQVRRGLCGAWPGALKLSVSMPDVWELPWLVVEWRDRRLWWDMLPALLPLARERLSSCSMSSSRASLMYDSRYCFFSEVREHGEVLLLKMVQIDQSAIPHHFQTKLRGCLRSYKESWGFFSCIRKSIPSFSSSRRTCLSTGCRFM